MIHIWQPSALRADEFLVWSETDSRWQSVSGWQGVTAICSAWQSVKAIDTSVCLYVPTASVLSVSNGLSASELKQLGDTGQQYLFEDISLTPVEQLQVRHRSNIAPPKTTQKITQNDALTNTDKLNSESHDVHNGDDNESTSSSLSATISNSTVLYALSQSRISSLQSSAELVGLTIVAILPDFVLLPTPDMPAMVTALDASRLLDLASDSTPVDSSIENTQSSHIQISNTMSSLTLRLSEHHGMAVSALPLLPLGLPQLEELTLLTFERNATNANNLLNELIQLCDEHHIVLTTQAGQPTPIANSSKHWLNFVQAKRNRLASPYLQVAMLVLLLAGMVQMLTDAIHWYRYEQATVTVKQANINQFEAWFAGETLNPKVMVQTQVEPRLSTQSTNEQNQLALLNIVSPLIKQNNVVAQSLRWDDTQIMLTLTSNSREGIDNLQRTLTGQNIPSNLGAITPTEEGVQAELSLPLTVVSETDTIANSMS